jgi:hypothetical protein
LGNVVKHYPLKTWKIGLAANSIMLFFIGGLTRKVIIFGIHPNTLKVTKLIAVRIPDFG